MRVNIWLIIIIVMSSFALAATGFTNQTQLYYGDSLFSTDTYYQDALPAKGNVDVGIELCDAGQNYVGAFYYINVSGTPQYSLVTYRDANDALTLASTNGTNSSCFKTSNSFVTVSPSNFAVPNPDINIAAFPGNLWIGWDSSSNNPGNISNFTYAEGNASLRGRYSITRAYQQDLDVVRLSSVAIVFESQSSNFSKSITDHSFGVSNERRLALGICNDTIGNSCSDGGIYTSNIPFFSNVDLDAGIGTVNVNDQTTFTRYVVANSIDSSICIGANLRAQISSHSPDPVAYNELFNYTVRIYNPRDSTTEANGGNINVTTDFDIRVTVINWSGTIFLDNITRITQTLEPNEDVNISFVWTANGPIGNYTVKVAVDNSSEIVECAESDNQGSDVFDIIPFTYSISNPITTSIINSSPYFNLTTSVPTACTATETESQIFTPRTQCYVSCQNGICEPLPCAQGSAGASAGGGGGSFVGLTSRLYNLSSQVEGNYKYTYTLRCRDSNSNYINISTMDPYTIRENNITISDFKPIVPVLFLNSTIDISFWYDIVNSADSVLLNISYPNGTSNMTRYVLSTTGDSFGNFWILNITNISQIGQYNFTVTLNDTVGFSVNASTTFRIGQQKIQNISFSNGGQGSSSGSRLRLIDRTTREPIELSTNTTFSKVIPDTDLYLSAIINNTFTVEIPINSSHTNISIFVKADNASIFDNSAKNIGTSRRYVPKLAVNFELENEIDDTFMVRINTTNLTITDYSDLVLFKAPYNWTTNITDYSSGTYFQNGSANFYIDEVNEYVELNITSFSTFILTEDGYTPPAESNSGGGGSSNRGGSSSSYVPKNVTNSTNETSIIVENETISEINDTVIESVLENESEITEIIEEQQIEANQDKFSLSTILIIIGVIIIFAIIGFVILKKRKSTFV